MPLGGTLQRSGFCSEDELVRLMTIQKYIEHGVDNDVIRWFFQRSYSVCFRMAVSFAALATDDRGKLHFCFGSRLRVAAEL